MTEPTYLDELAWTLANRCPRIKTDAEQAAADASLNEWFKRNERGCRLGIQEAAEGEI